MNQTRELPSRVLTLDLVQATEAAALAAARWVALGQPEAADRTPQNDEEIRAKARSDEVRITATED